MMLTHAFPDMRDVLSDAPFPDFPFVDEKWRGLIFNRDLHGAAGVPVDVFHSVATSLALRNAMPLRFLPAVTTPAGTNPYPNADVKGWQDYLALLRRIGSCPEYYLLAADRSLVLWIDPDTVVVGSHAGLMDDVAARLGGMQHLMQCSALEFGLELDDAASAMAGFIRLMGAPSHQA